MEDARTIGNSKIYVVANAEKVVIAAHQGDAPTVFILNHENANLLVKTMTAAITAVLEGKA